MSHPSRTFASCLVAIIVSASPRALHADEPPSPLRVSVICETPPAPGRFRCDVEARVSGATLSWAEVSVVKVDDFILPLRGRFGPRDASAHDFDIYRWSLGFVAKGRGNGEVQLRVRAVVCHGSACDPVEADVSGRVLVGR